MISSKSDYVGSNNASIKLATTTHAHDAMFVAPPDKTVTQQSTGEEITYRPFSVREEKILLIALESEESESILTAIQQIIENCIIQGNVNISELPLFDLENIFLNIRSKSVGETSTISVPCTSETC